MRKLRDRPVHHHLFATFVVMLLAASGLMSRQWVQAFSGGDGSQGNPYLVGTCADLAAIDTALTSHFKLTQNLSCGEIAPLARDWDDAANKPSIGFDGFGGELNGNGKSITFTMTTNAGQNCRALFCYVKGGSIHDLTLNGEVRGGQFVGAVIGLSKESSVTHVTSNVDIVAHTTSDPAQNIGGLVGKMCDGAQNCTLDDNIVTGDITVTADANAGWVGGLVGYFGTLTDNIRTTWRNQHSGNITVTAGDAVGGNGGLFGSGTDLRAEQSTNTGNLALTATTPSVGQVYQSAGIFGTGDRIEVVDSYSTGDVIGTAPNGGHSFGGLIGYGTLLAMRRSYNTGAVTVNVNGLAFQGVGGLVGFMPGDTVVDHSFNAGAISSNVASASMTGAVTGTAPDGASAVSAAYFDMLRSTLTKCIGDVASPASCTGINPAGAQSAYFFSSSNAPLNGWNFTDVWQANTGAYPTLRAFSAGGSQQSTGSQQNADTESSTPAQKLSTDLALEDFDDYASGNNQPLIDLPVGQVVTFTVGASADTTQKHSVTVNQVGSNFVVVTLASDPQTATLYVGDSKQYDVTGDKITDIQLTLLSVDKGVADISFKRLGGASLAPTDQPAVVTAKPKATAASRNFVWIWVVVSATGIVGGLAVVYLMRHRQQKAQAKPIAENKVLHRF